jgi:hypothetical protein
VFIDSTVGRPAGGIVTLDAVRWGADPFTGGVGWWRLSMVVPSSRQDMTLQR